MEKEGYTIKTVNFEGPFVVLLNLIEERKLFINEISLADVTEDYLKYVNGLNDLSPADIASFIVVAATLILIKSKSLLPNLNLTLEEEGDIKNLEDRLKLFERYARLAGNIKINFGKNIIYYALERKNDTLVFLPDEQITKESMMTFARGALGRIPTKVFLPKVEVKKVVSIEEMIDRLTKRIEKSLTLNFKEFAGRAVTREERVEVIVGFLAMLEMVRQGILNVAQENNFEDILIEKNETPNGDEEILIVN
ncbi:MAG: segregation/condensation protein A [bacterium]